MTEREEAIRLLEELYAGLPTVDCQGHCWNACGPINMSIVERERIEDAGVSIPPFSEERSEAWRRNEPLHCSALDDDGRCTVYEIRPLICRIWGVGRGELACTHGCKVTGTRLRLTEVMQLMSRSMVIGGDERYLSWGVDPNVITSDPEVVKYMAAYVNGDTSVIGKLRDAAARAARRTGAH